MFFALKKENIQTERKCKSLTTTPEKPSKKFSLSKPFSDSQPQEETSSLSTSKKPFFIHLNNLCSSQNKVNIKETTTPRFSLHAKEKVTTEEENSLGSDINIDNAQQTTNKLKERMSEDIIECFAPEDTKLSSSCEGSNAKDAKVSPKVLTEEIENDLPRNEADTVFQLLEENYEMTTALLYKMEITDTPEFLALLSELTLRMENAFQTIN